MPKDPISELDISACILALRQCRGIAMPVVTGTDIILERADFARLCDLCDEDMIVGACKTYNGRSALLAVLDHVPGRVTVYDVTLPWHMHAAGIDPTLYPPSPIIARHLDGMSMQSFETALDFAFELRRATTGLGNTFSKPLINREKIES